MKKVFLTSNMGCCYKVDGKRFVKTIDNRNGIIELIKNNLDKEENFLFFASSPNDYEKTDDYSRIVFQSFNMSGFNFKKLIVIDENVNRLYSFSKYEISNTFFCILPSGESTKDIRFVLDIITILTNNNFSKYDLLIGIGGGVILDLVGFVSAIYKRGITFISFPTTLLSMVDSSLGGKNGINYLGIKNVVGTIYKPNKTIINLAFLNTLSDKEYASGLMETLKMGILYDESLVSLIENNDINTIRLYSKEIITRSRQIKSDICKKDLYDKGIRKSLNLGHTIGHALEEAGLNLLHGEAIAIGLIPFVNKESKNRIKCIIKKYIKLDYSIFKLDLMPLLLSKIENDKKNTYGINVVIINENNDFTLKKIDIKEMEDIIRGLFNEISLWN